MKAPRTGVAQSADAHRLVRLLTENPYAKVIFKVGSQEMQIEQIAYAVSSSIDLGRVEVSLRSIPVPTAMLDTPPELI